MRPAPSGRADKAERISKYDALESAISSALVDAEVPDPGWNDEQWARFCKKLTGRLAKIQ